MYEMLLNTISITLDCLNAQTTEFVPEYGPITQSIWGTNETRQIKEQIKGLLSKVPEPSYFNC